MAQPTVAWAKCFGGKGRDVATSMVSTRDGGYLVAGSTTSVDGDVVGLHDSLGNFADYWLVKLDSLGSVEWKKCIGGTAGDYPTCIIPTKDSGWAICGYTWSLDDDASGNINFYSSDFWVVKLSAADTIQWERTYGGYQNDMAYSMVETSDGGYVVVGNTTSPDGFVTGFHGRKDVWMIKIDSIGALKWEHCYGGSGDESANSVVQTKDGGFVFCGTTNSPDGDISGVHYDIFGQPTNDVWVVKTDSGGIMEWNKTYGGGLQDYGNTVLQTVDGGYSIFGTADFGRTDSGYYFFDDYWLIKVDGGGNILWQQSYGGSNYDDASTMIQCKDGGYLLAGKSWSDDREVSGNHGGYDDWLVKTDSLGAVEWTQCYGGAKDEVPFCILETKDGGFAVAGSTISLDGDVSGLHDSCYYDAVQTDSVCNPDYWVFKLNPYVAGPKITAPKGTSVFVYPNPLDDHATLVFRLDSLPANCLLKLYDGLGQEVRSEALTGDSNSILIYRESLPKGIYICEVLENNKEILAVGKLVIE